jgi:hypothetical protein
MTADDSRYLRGVMEVAAAMADGDLTQNVEPKSARNGLGTSFKKMIANLRELVGQVQASAISARVAQGYSEVELKRFSGNPSLRRLEVQPFSQADSSSADPASHPGLELRAAERTGAPAVRRLAVVAGGFTRGRGRSGLHAPRPHLQRGGRRRQRLACVLALEAGRHC